MLHVSRGAWWRAASAGVLAVGVLVTGGVLRTAAADEPPRTDQAPKEKTRGDDARADQDVQKQLDQLRREMAQMRKQMEILTQRGGFPNFLAVPGMPGAGDGRRFSAEFPGRFGGGQPRLGVLVDPPSETLADQLDLKKGQGLVVREVIPDSPAAKVGLKPHDVLVELNGKSVPNDVRGFADMVADVKADAAVDATVIRKGKAETVKGIKLREGPPERPRPPGDAGRDRPRR